MASNALAHRDQRCSRELSPDSVATPNGELNNLYLKLWTLEAEGYQLSMMQMPRVIERITIVPAEVPDE